MKQLLRLGICLLAATAGLFPVLEAATPSKSGTKPGTTYKWVDEHGVTHYGDGLPPDAGNTGAQVLNRNAIAVRDVPAQPRVTEGAAVSQPQVDETAQEAQRRRDRVLLSTYTSLRDIERLRDERVSQINNQITSTRGYIETVTQRLETLRQRAFRFKPYAASPEARRMPDTLTAELVQALNEERLQREFLAAREQEVKNTQNSFQADADRYQKLVGR